MEDTNIFVDNDEELISITPFPFGFYQSSKNNILYSPEGTMAQLLVRLQSFYQSIKKARVSVGIKDTFLFPENLQLDDVIGLKYKHLDSSQRQSLDNEVETILRKYGLRTNWKVSIEAAILTRTLPIPYPAQPISVHLPVKRDITDGKVLESAYESALAVVRQGEVLKYPAIYFTSRFSRRELLDWVKNNRQAIEAINSVLPGVKEIGIKMKPKTERIGAIAFILKRDGINRWAKMEKVVENMSKVLQMDNYWEEDYLPGAEDLRLAYKSYKELLRKLDTSVSESK